VPIYSSSRASMQVGGSVETTPPLAYTKTQGPISGGFN